MFQIAVSDAGAQKTLNELLEAIASNQTTVQEIEDPIHLEEIQPMKEIIKAAQEIQEVLSNDANKDKSVDDVDESVKDNDKKRTRQDKGPKLGTTVQDIDTSTNKKSRRKKKATTGQDKEIKHAESSEDITKKSTQDKYLNENFTLHNKLQELAPEHQKKPTQDIKALEIENLQENEYDNYIEIEVPFEIPQTNELSETQRPIDKCQQLNAIQAPVLDIGHRAAEKSNEIEQTIEKMEIPNEDKQDIQLEQDLQTIQETLIPFEDKPKEDFANSIEKTKENIQDTTQLIKETTVPIEETTQVEVKNEEYTKDTNMKDIPGSVFEKFCTAHVSYIGNKEKGEFPNRPRYFLMLGTGF